MAQGKLISLKTVLYELSTMVDEKHWNETLFYEWAAKAFLKFKTYYRYETCIKVVEVVAHKAQLPADTEIILHVAYKPLLSESALEDMIRVLGLQNETWNPAVSHMELPEALAQKALFATYANKSGWIPMRLSTNDYLKSINCDITVYDDTGYLADNPMAGAGHEYTIERGNCLTTTMRDGMVAVAYRRRITDENGDLLIPDNEDVKEAILHFVLYRHWLRRAGMKEQGAGEWVKFHLDRYDFLKRKAVGDLNEPTIDELENFKNDQQSLVRRHHAKSNFFQGLGQPRIDPYQPHYGRR